MIYKPKISLLIATILLSTTATAQIVDPGPANQTPNSHSIDLRGDASNIASFDIKDDFRLFSLSIASTDSEKFACWMEKSPPFQIQPPQTDKLPGKVFSSEFHSMNLLLAIGSPNSIQFQKLKYPKLESVETSPQISADNDDPIKGTNFNLKENKAIAFGSKTAHITGLQSNSEHKKYSIREGLTIQNAQILQNYAIVALGIQGIAIFPLGVDNQASIQYYDNYDLDLKSNFQINQILVHEEHNFAIIMGSSEEQSGFSVIRVTESGKQNLVSHKIFTNEGSIQYAGLAQESFFIVFKNHESKLSIVQFGLILSEQNPQYVEYEPLNTISNVNEYIDGSPLGYKQNEGLLIIQGKENSALVDLRLALKSTIPQLIIQSFPNKNLIEGSELIPLYTFSMFVVVSIKDDSMKHSGIVKEDILRKITCQSLIENIDSTLYCSKRSYSGALLNETEEYSIQFTGKTNLPEFTLNDSPQLSKIASGGAVKTHPHTGNGNNGGHNGGHNGGNNGNNSNNGGNTGNTGGNNGHNGGNTGNQSHNTIPHHGNDTQSHNNRNNTHHGYSDDDRRGFPTFKIILIFLSFGGIGILFSKLIRRFVSNGRRADEDTAHTLKNSEDVHLKDVSQITNYDDMEMGAIDDKHFCIDGDDEENDGGEDTNGGDSSTQDQSQPEESKEDVEEDQSNEAKDSQGQEDGGEEGEGDDQQTNEQQDNVEEQGGDDETQGNSANKGDESQADE